MVVAIHSPVSGVPACAAPASVIAVAAPCAVSKGCGSGWPVLSYHDLYPARVVLAPLDDDLVARLRREFDAHGQRSEQALRTAEAILRSGLREEHMPVAVASLIRNAMDAILQDAQDDFRSWSDVSREVVAAYDAGTGCRP